MMERRYYVKGDIFSGLSGKKPPETASDDENASMGKERELWNFCFNIWARSNIIVCRAPNAAVPVADTLPSTWNSSNQTMNTSVERRNLISVIKTGGHLNNVVSMNISFSLNFPALLFKGYSYPAPDSASSSLDSLNRIDQGTTGSFLHLPSAESRSCLRKTRKVCTYY